MQVVNDHWAGGDLSCNRCSTTNAPQQLFELLDRTRLQNTLRGWGCEIIKFNEWSRSRSDERTSSNVASGSFRVKESKIGYSYLPFIACVLRHKIQNGPFLSHMIFRTNAWRLAINNEAVVVHHYAHWYGAFRKVSGVHGRCLDCQGTHFGWKRNIDEIENLGNNEQSSLERNHGRNTQNRITCGNFPRPLLQVSRWTQPRLSTQQ